MLLVFAAVAQTSSRSAHNNQRLRFSYFCYLVFHNSPYPSPFYPEPRGQSAAQPVASRVNLCSKTAGTDAGMIDEPN
jgi:hypothetical protein